MITLIIQSLIGMGGLAATGILFDNLVRAIIAYERIKRELGE